jgi:hypothetical protein
MDLIFKLREECILKDKKLREAEDNMEIFKNELINREELYNKYFGNNPKVGFLNPLKAKDSNNSTNIEGVRKDKVRLKLFKLEQRKTFNE